ncbi:hypothetical protein ABZ079_29455 [Streptomyces sp. NPDC006314]|uniref:hypothetical protein n=1 Tax=Streptomyces sp. NPDC006314 TaxID=3154475 RepID=UPI0033ABB863
MARPVHDSVTNALIVKPYMLLHYGRILDPAKHADREAYAVHLKWITERLFSLGSRDISAIQLAECKARAHT